MPTAHFNGVRLYYEMHGSGDELLVFVHGAWASHKGWRYTQSHLTDTFRVLAYDRRGHSNSRDASGPHTIGDDVADLAALIQEVADAPPWVIGLSGGASIVLRLAAEHPALLRGLIAHEPAVLMLLRDDPDTAPLLQTTRQELRAVADRVTSGDHAGAAEQFFELIAPGYWPHMPADLRQTFIDNAPTFVDDLNDLEQNSFEVEWLREFSQPLLLTVGEQSPPFFQTVAHKVADGVRGAEVKTIRGAGHIPHLTHPERFARIIAEFVGQHAQAHAGR